MTKQCIICGSYEFKLKSERFCSQDCIHKYASNKSAQEKIKCEICDKEYSKSGYKQHLRTHIKKEIHYFCENCNKEVVESFGSNRFCSKECARSFSTKEKRLEINKKVKDKLTLPLIEKICPICSQLYYTTTNKNRKTCSKQCGNILTGQKTLGRKNIIKDSSRMGGLRAGGGRCKQYSYINHLGYIMSLNKDEILVAQEFDKLSLNWNRNSKGFPYTTIEGKNRKYYPDFVINEDIYVEYKGYILPDMIHKMNDAKEKNNLNLTIIVSDSPRFRDKGYLIEDIKNINWNET